MSLLVNNVHVKTLQKSQDRLNFESMCTLFVMCTGLITLHLYYMKNALIFSQSEVQNFFMYSIK